MSNVGDEFQQQTKYRPGAMGDEGMQWNLRPEPYKTYPGNPGWSCPRSSRTGP